MSHSNSKKILFCVSGSIAAFKAADVVSKLVQNDFDVQVVFSRNADKFIGRMTFEGLTSKPVLDGVFAEGHAMSHIDLVRDADLMVICPASADLLSQLAHGAAGDLISTLFLARQLNLKTQIYPAMNTVMWRNPLVQKNVEILRSLPLVEVIEPAAGSLACGEVGSGRLPEPPQILKNLLAHFDVRNPQLIPLTQTEEPKRILITGGGTSEPIDSVRFITNTSSGATASAVAEAFKARGHQVDLLLAKSARVRPDSLGYTEFTSHGDLSERLRGALSNTDYDAVIHMAAVSDFSLAATEGKLSSQTEKLDLSLKPTSKIIHFLREWSRNKKACLIGFKLTANLALSERQEKVARLFKDNDLNFVVSNDLSKIDSEKHQGFIFDHALNKKSFANKQELGARLIQTVEEFT